MSSQLESGFIWVQAVAHLLLPWFRATALFPLKVSSKQCMNWIANEIHFVTACLCQKGEELWLYSCIIGWTRKIFMHYWPTFGEFNVLLCHAILELWHTKAVTLYCGKSGRWYRPRSSNWANPFWVKLTSSVLQHFCTKMSCSLTTVSGYLFHTMLDGSKKAPFSVHIT